MACSSKEIIATADVRTYHPRGKQISSTSLTAIRPVSLPHHAEIDRPIKHIHKISPAPVRESQRPGFRPGAEPPPRNVASVTLRTVPPLQLPQDHYGGSSIQTTQSTPPEYHDLIYDPFGPRRGGLPTPARQTWTNPPPDVADR